MKILKIDQSITYLKFLEREKCMFKNKGKEGIIKLSLKGKNCILLQEI